jgi:hypothetical protein
MYPAVSRVVFGEKSSRANSSHRSSSSPTVAVVLVARPRSASTFISLSNRWASRLPARTVFVA